MKKDIVLTGIQMREICRRCIENVEGLLDGADLLRAGDKTQQYGLGLYMYEIEEYGKAQLLKGLYSVNKKAKYLIPGWIFGRYSYPSRKQTSHILKIIEGLKNLPAECLKLSSVIELTVNTSPKNKQFDLGLGLKVAVPAGLTGFFEDTTRGPFRKVEFDYKTACFYIDWDDAKEIATFVLPANKDRLKINIKLFRDALKGFDFV